MLGILYLSAAVLFAFSSAAETCFYPDGTTSEPNHSPCNLTIPASACCDPADACSTSGLCLGRTGFTYRGTCTDKTWKSGNCPKSDSLDPFDNVAYSATTPLLSCDKPGSPPSNFCCNSPGHNCCTIATFVYGNTGFGFNPGMDYILKSLADAQNVVKNLAMNNSARPQTAHFPGPGQFSMCLTSAATIGIAVGAPLGSLVIGVIGFLFWREKRNERREREGKADDGNESDDGSNLKSTIKRERPQAFIMDADSRAKERPYYFDPGPPPKLPAEIEKETYMSPASRSNTMTSLSGRSKEENMYRPPPTRNMPVTGRAPPPVMRTKMEKVDRRGDMYREPEGVNELI